METRYVTGAESNGMNGASVSGLHDGAPERLSTWQQLMAKHVMGTERQCFRSWRSVAISARLRSNEAEVLRRAARARGAAGVLHAWRHAAEELVHGRRRELLAVAVDSLRLKAAAMRSWARGAARRARKRLRRYEAVSSWATRRMSWAFDAWLALHNEWIRRYCIADSACKAANDVRARSSLTSWKMIAELLRARDQVVVREFASRRYLSAWRRANYRSLQLAYYAHVTRICHRRKHVMRTMRAWRRCARARLDARQRSVDAIMKMHKLAACTHAWLIMSRRMFRLRIIYETVHASRCLLIVSRCMSAWTQVCNESRQLRARYFVAVDADVLRRKALGLRAWRRYMAAVERERVYTAYADAHAAKGRAKRIMRAMRRIVARSNFEKFAEKRGARMLLRRALRKWTILIVAARHYTRHLLTVHFAAIYAHHIACAHAIEACEHMIVRRRRRAALQCLEWWRDSYVPSRKRIRYLDHAAREQRRIHLLRSAVRGFCGRVDRSNARARAFSLAIAFQTAQTLRRAFYAWTDYVSACRERHAENAIKVRLCAVLRDTKTKTEVVAAWQAVTQRAAAIEEDVRESQRRRVRTMYGIAFIEWRRRAHEWRRMRNQLKCATLYRERYLLRLSISCLGRHRAVEVGKRRQMEEAMDLFRSRMQQHVATVWLEVSQCRRSARIEMAATAAAREIVESLHKVAPYARRWKANARRRALVRERIRADAASVDEEREIGSDGNASSCPESARDSDRMEMVTAPKKHTHAFIPPFQDASSLIAREMQRIGENFRAACALAEPAFQSSATILASAADSKNPPAHENQPQSLRLPSPAPSLNIIDDKDDETEFHVHHRRQAFLAELARLESELASELERRRRGPSHTSHVDHQSPQGALKVV